MAGNINDKIAGLTATFKKVLELAIASACCAVLLPCAIAFALKPSYHLPIIGTIKEVENIPVRIVERRADNTYRVRGQQFLTIKKRPYKVIATALIRAEDFKDDGISSNKLLEAQYDVVHMKRVNNE